MLDLNDFSCSFRYRGARARILWGLVFLRELYNGFYPFTYWLVDLPSPSPNYFFWFFVVFQTQVSSWFCRCAALSVVLL